MNIRFVLVMLISLAFALTFAQAATLSAAPQAQDPVQIAPNDPSVQFDLISPDNNEVFQMTSNIDIDFSFVATPYDFEDETTYISSCKISIRNADSALPTIELDTSFNQATGAGNIQYLFNEAGQYFWRVSCLSSDGADWNSNELSFSIIRAAPIAPVENEQPSNSSNNPTNTNNNNNGGSNNDDSNGRRLQPISLPLQELSNTAEDSEDQESSPGITGAVIGALKGKTLAGIIILVVVVGIAGLVIYNRRKLGVVKAK